MASERRSTFVADAAPAPAEPIADFDLVGIEDGSTRLRVQARPIEGLRPTLAARAVADDTTAFDLFLAGLRDAVHGDVDSEWPGDETDEEIAEILERLS